ncbi:AI-2E family transporter [Candidatus Peregrinibacteria bacterium]|nr:AI-2E family transporter [Candidatus Peregrinibacteria bacterium]
MKKNVSELLGETMMSMKNLKEQWRKKMEELKHIRSQETEEPLIHDLPKAKAEKTLVDLSPKSIAKATMVVILLYTLTQFVYGIKDILLLFFLALLFSAALDPTVDRLERKKIPRSISILCIYLIIFIILVIFISNFIPLVASQLIELAQRVGEIVNNLTIKGTSNIPFVDRLKPFVSQFLESADRQTLIEGAKTALLKVGEQLQGLAGNAWNALKVIFNGIFNVIMVLVITFYMTLEERSIQHFIKSIFPHRHEKYIIAKTHAIKNKIGGWLRGQIILCLSIGIVVTITLRIMGVEYYATLGMIAAIGEFIPYIGSIIAAIPAVLIAFNQSSSLALGVIIAYVIIQQLENNILVPLIMRQAVGLSPIIVIFAVLIGAKFLGILGIILAVPVTTIIWLFVQDYVFRER